MNRSVRLSLWHTAIVVMALAVNSTALAGAPNPFNGYLSVHESVGEKATYGRCNALGILAAKISDRCYDQDTPIITTDMNNDCYDAGVNFDEDSTIADCLEERTPDCSNPRPTDPC